MKYARVESAGSPIVCGWRDGRLYDVSRAFGSAGQDLGVALALGILPQLEEAVLSAKSQDGIDPNNVRFLTPLANPGKIICLGINYAEHAAEASLQKPDYPVLFLRATSSLIAHGEAIRKPLVSNALDFEGELAAIVGKKTFGVEGESALECIAGYALFNDASIRDYQLRTSQWTIGKNFDGTGAVGPYFVTADELPLGARGLRIETRLNGNTVQSANTDDMIFDVASTVRLLSQCMTLFPGDVIVMGTPPGVGGTRKPPLWMKPGDICEVEVERVGVLRNPIAEATSTR